MPVLSFYSRMGGKSLIRKQIIAKFPKDYHTYVEPFFGAGHVFFDKEPSAVEVINDLDKEVMDAIADVQIVTVHEVERFEFPENRGHFERLKHQPCSTPAERLYRFLYLKWMSFGGMGQTYAPTKATQTNSQQRIRSFLKKLPLIQQRLNPVRIHNEDYLEIMKRYDASDTFFYLDPPFYKTSVKEYTHKYIDIEVLRDYLKTIKGKFLLSYNDDPYIRVLFQDDFHIESLPVRYVIKKGCNNIKRQELLIMNYHP